MTEIDTWQTPFLQGLMAPVFDERDDRDLRRAQEPHARRVSTLHPDPA